MKHVKKALVSNTPDGTVPSFSLGEGLYCLRYKIQRLGIS